MLIRIGVQIVGETLIHASESHFLDQPNDIAEAGGQQTPEKVPPGIQAMTRPAGITTASMSVSAVALAGKARSLSMHDAVRMQHSPGSTRYSVISRPDSASLNTLALPAVTSASCEQRSP